ncbi:40S ribosomal protein S17 [Anaeramoeba flamelloides]|uniref:40S ribosomal protein S17 n=1 Tax=Anaeramoeba flamelloides TaxID=1746091 RepID=A0AAV7Z7I9_9EUKA|nr:40S ribosomal protein S17 [Anaeramoeba flamelloides]
MGRVRTKTVKRAARLIVEKYYTKLTIDFQVNKKICSEVASIPTKRLRNKIAGYVTHLMKRIERGPVPGISIKLQEEEKERRDNWFLTGLLQFAYVFLVGKFPFNSFLAGFISTVGCFVLTINLRTLVDPENKETKVSAKRAFVDFLICNVILHLAVFNYIG